MFRLAAGAAVLLMAQPARSDVRFSRQVQPILDANCVTCHQQGAAQMNLVLEEGQA